MSNFEMSETVVEDGANIIEITVGEGDDVASIHAEDGESVVDMLLNVDEIDALIAALQRAREIVANG